MTDYLDADLAKKQRIHQLLRLLAMSNLITGGKW